VEAVESASARAGREPPGPRSGEGEGQPEACEGEHEASGFLGNEPRLSKCDVGNGDRQSDTKSPCTYTQRSAEPEATLCARSEQPYPIDTWAIAAHPLV
jgi:hypothetical protein